jgi:hypothetical protein
VFGELTADLNHRGDYLENRQRIVLRHTVALGANLCLPLHIDGGVFVHPDLVIKPGLEQLGACPFRKFHPT